MFKLANIRQVSRDQGYGFLNRALSRQRTRVRDDDSETAEAPTDPPAEAATVAQMSDQLKTIQEKLGQMASVHAKYPRMKAVDKRVLRQFAQDQQTASIGEALTQGVFSFADRALLKMVKNGDDYDLHLDTMELLKIVVITYAAYKLLDYAVKNA